MKNRHFRTMCMVALLGMGCENSSDNNQPLKYNTLSVNFKGTLSAIPWQDGSEIGIFSTCTRNQMQHVPMSTNANAKYKAIEAKEATDLQLASGDDEIVTIAADHNIQFYAYYPYSSEVTAPTALKVGVAEEQSFAKGFMNYTTFVAKKSISSVVPTVNLDFEGIFSTIEFFLPNDITNQEGQSVIKSLTLKPTVAENFSGALALNGTYNLQTAIFTPNTEGQAQQIVVDFGPDGISLTEAYTKVPIAVAPFTVPEGGMTVVIKDNENKLSTIPIFNKEENRGFMLEAGKLLTQYLIPGDDGVIPVTFPVVFPVGYSGGAYVFSAASQPKWITDGMWICPTQTQAWAQWYKVSDPGAQFKQKIEYVNSGNKVGSPGIKGIWTGDYLEFTIPVKKFAANTSITTTFPMYTRQGPVFWVIEYLDGEQWKCNKEQITCYDARYSQEATFTLIRGGKIITHTMTFINAIKSGHVKIRIKCADGTIQADADKTVAVRTTPWTDAAGYGAPFYLHLDNSDIMSVTFSTN